MVNIIFKNDYLYSNNLRKKILEYPKNTYKLSCWVFRKHRKKIVSKISVFSSLTIIRKLNKQITLNS